MGISLQHIEDLKQNLLDFVLDTEGELATQLEQYCADHLARFQKSQFQGNGKTNLIVDCFLSEGQIQNQTPLALFIEQTPTLSSEDHQLIRRWQRCFTGLFQVMQVLPEGFELMNWLTAKRYIVYPNSGLAAAQVARLQPGEIILTRIAPFTDTQWWMFSTTLFLLGKLGKPKLAVAVGQFRHQFKEDLYGDAPELLEAAWNSVEHYDQEFIEFFGNRKITLPGYQANQKLKAFQEQIAQRRFDEMAGPNPNGLQELTQQAHASGAATSLQKPAMATPQPEMRYPTADLPEPLKQAETLTLLSHPRWGQMVLPTYHQIEARLEAQDWQSCHQTEGLIQDALADPDMNAYVWQQLAQTYPQPLESILQGVLKNPNFKLDQDLSALLQTHNKPLEPDLPETASVPLHLHTLFQEAMKMVHQGQRKQKAKPKGSRGFQV